MEVLLFVAVQRSPFEKPWGGSEGRSIIALRAVRWRARVPLLLRHDRSRRIGFAHGFVLVPRHGLACKATIEDPSAARVIRFMLTKDPQSLGVSCGFVRTKTGRVEHVAEGKTAVINGRRRSGPLDVHRGLRIVEVSITPNPCDSATRIYIQREEAPELEEARALSLSAEKTP